MTAEVVIMNRGAVALAADSAVTMQGGKIFNSANKLFMLAPGYSIGVLLYNNAALMDIPWEILIKKYRQYLEAARTIFPTLESCADDFISFLENNSAKLFPPGAQRVFLGTLLELTMRDDIRAAIQGRARDVILERGAKVTEEEFHKICEDVIESVCRPWLSSADLPGKPSSEVFEATFSDMYGELFDEHYSKHLATLPINDEARAKLRSACAAWCYKDRWFLSFFSGVVFAGYGDDDLFPSTVAYQVESYLCGHLKFKQGAITKIGLDHHQASLSPFAQDDMVLSFITGIHPEYAAVLNQVLTAFVKDTLPTALAAQINVGDDQREALKQTIAAIGTQKMVEAFANIRQGVGQRYTEPILHVVAALPKEELAVMAETLVNITSFMRRVSSALETVGGPTDVAVISRKDGFVWIKRKHYFDQEHNYHFFNQPSGRGARSDAGETKS